MQNPTNSSINPYVFTVSLTSTVYVLFLYLALWRLASISAALVRGHSPERRVGTKAMLSLIFIVSFSLF